MEALLNVGFGLHLASKGACSRKLCGGFIVLVRRETQII